jgi:antirestriction protein ArdC
LVDSSSLSRPTIPFPYLSHWIKAIEADLMGIFSVAKDADRMADYMLGLERELVSLEPP